MTLSSETAENGAPAAARAGGSCGRVLVAACIGLILAALPGFATDLFVVDAKGIDLALGAKLDGGKPLILAVGQRVTLVTSDGRTLKLKGPYDSAPAPEAEGQGPDMATSLKGLITARAADTTAAGIIRQGTASYTLPSPWLLEILNSGDRCLLAGQKTILWREDTPATAGALEIEPVDHSWAANATWPAGSDKLALPARMVLKNGQAYLIRLDGTPVNVTIHVIPSSVKTDAAKAAWMIEVGCETQAKALIETLR